MKTQYAQKHELFKHKKHVCITEVIIFSLLMLIARVSTAQTPRITYSHAIDITSKPPPFEKELDLSIETTAIQDIEFNPDGTKMFVLDLNGAQGTILQYSLSIPFDILTASYDDVDIDKGDVSIIPVAAMTGITFGQEGTLLYVSFLSGHVSQITLANPYNLSSFTSSGEASKVIVGTATLQDIQLSSDGRSLFALNEQRILNYALDTPFDLASRTLLGGHDVDDEETFPTSLFLFSSGSQLMIVGGDGDEINQYSLSSYNHTSIFFNGSPFDVSSETTFPKSIFVDPKGKRLFISGSSSVFSYLLTQSDSYNENIDNEGLVEGEIRINLENAGEGFILPNSGLDRLMTEGTHFTIHNKPEGLIPQMNVAGDTKSILLSFEGNAINNSHNADISNLRFSFTDEAFQSLSASEIENAINANSHLGIDFIGNPEVRYTVPVDIVSESPIHNGSPFSVANEESASSGLVFDPLGNNLFVVGAFGVTQYLLEDVPFETTEITSTEGTFSISAQTTSPSDILFDPSGTRAFVLDRTETAIFQYTLSRPFDIFSAAYNQISFSVSDAEEEPTGMAFNNTGYKLFVIGNSNKEIVEYALDLSFDLSDGAILNNTSSFVSTHVAQPEDLVFDPTGSKVLILDSGSDRIHQFSLNSGLGFNISNGIHDGSLLITGQEFNGTGLAIHPKGTALYVIGSDGDEINQYSLKEAFAFKESEANDGSVTGSMKIRVDEDGFFGTDVLSSSAYTIPNLPAGLTPTFELENARTGTLTLNGNVGPNDHNDETADDIEDLIFQFFNFAFISDDVSLILNTNNASSNLGIDFDENLLQAQTITFNDPGDQVFGASFTLNASSSSSLPVSFSVIEGPIEITGNQVDITGTGTATIAANQAGNEDYDPADEVTHTITINKAFQSINFPEITEKVFGDQFLLEATASSGLPITYNIDQGFAEIINGNELLITSVGDGEIIVTAWQAGDENYHAVLGVQVSFEVFKAEQIVTIEPIADKLTTDPPFEIVASISSGLEFELNHSGPIIVEGATVTLTGEAGIATIAISHPGGQDYNPATKNVTFAISSPDKSDQTITVQPISAKLITDSPFEVNATTSSGLSLEYTIIEGPATITGNTVSLTGQTGSVKLKVSQAGNKTYNPVEVQTTFNVTDLEKTGQTITFMTIGDKVFGDAPFELSASSSSNLDVEFSVVSGPVTINGTTATINGAGIAVISANQAGNNDFNPAPDLTASFTINKADQVIILGSVGDKLTTDAPFEISASVDSGLELTYEVSGPASISGTTIALDGTTGSVIITVSQAGNDDYEIAEISTSFEVTIAEVLTIDEISSIQLYPNPITKFLMIESEYSVEVNIYNFNGKRVLNAFSHTGMIDLTNLANGTYILEVHNGLQSIKSKIIKVN